MDSRLALFTRQQVRDRTGIPDDMLNYWSRKGVLRPAEGGEGRGQHRRFGVIEVNIAAVLFQLKEVTGANIGTLEEVANALRESAEYVAALPFDSRLLGAALDHLSWSPADPAQEMHGELPPDLVERVRRHNERDAQDLPADVVEQVSRLDQREARARLSTYWAICEIPSDDVSSEDPTFLYRDVSGRWLLSTSMAFAPRETFTVIAIEIGRLLHSVWYGDRQGDA